MARLAETHAPGGAVFITGAGGFIGDHLRRGLPHLGHPVIAHTTRLPDPALTDSLRRETPEWLVHCAGPASVPASMADPQRDFRDSVLATESLFEAVAATSPGTKVVFLSSAAVYGEPDRLPIREDTPTRPVSPYGFHKLMCELIARKYAALRGVPVTILRVFSAYGPGLRRQVLWDICEKAARSQVIELHGTGEETRDFIEIGDVVQAIHLTLANSPFDGRVINVASGCTTSIACLAEILVRALGRRNTVRFVGAPREGDPLHWQVDVEALRALGKRAFLSMEDGAARYVAWHHQVD